MADKKAKVVTLSKDPVKGIVTVTVVGFPPLVVNLSDFTEEQHRMAEVHGVGQKLVDAAALGAEATPAEKYAEVAAVHATLVAGQWNSEREGGANSMLFEAIRLWQPTMSAEAIQAVLDDMSDKEKRDMPFDAEIAPHYKAVRDARAAKAGKGVDTASIKARFKAKV